MKRVLFFGLILAMVLAGCSNSGKSGTEETRAAAAGPFAGSFAEFQSAVAAKEYGKALAALRSLMLYFWAESSLFLENIKFVKGANNSFGLYEPRENDAFSPGEPIYLYMEPAGYVIKKNPAGYYEFGFKADFQVTAEGGKVLGGQTDFASLSFKSWNPNTEIAITFTYTLSGLEKGKYRMITKVADVHSAKNASCEKWFTIE